MSVRTAIRIHDRAPACTIRPPPKGMRSEAMTAPAEVEEETKKLRELLPADTTDNGDTPEFWTRVVAFSLGQRIAALCSNCAFLAEQGDALSSAIIARSALETAAVLYYLQKKVYGAIERKDFKELDDIVGRMFLGNKDKPDWQPVQVLTCLDHLGKLVKPTTEAYNNLSELAHPNWWGTAALFCKLSENPQAARFGLRADNAEHAIRDGLVAASSAARLAHLCIELILKALPPSTQIRAILAKGGKFPPAAK